MGVGRVNNFEWEKITLKLTRNSEILLNWFGIFGGEGATNFDLKKEEFLLNQKQIYKKRILDMI